MKLRLEYTVALVGSLVAFAGCGNAKDAADSIASGIANADLNHTWVRDHCSSSKIIGKSYRVQFEYKGNEVKRTEQYFSSADCNELAGTVVYSGLYERKPGATKELAQLDSHFTTVSITPLNEAGKNLLNSTSFCGDGTWELNQAKDMTACTTRALSPLTKLPQSSYDIVTIEGVNLYMGEGAKKEDPAKRPSKLDREISYRKM
jgi:hypothetical protein